MSEVDLQTLRSEITSVNSRCCEDVRTWTPSRRPAPKLLPQLVSDRASLQRLLQERLQASLSRDRPVQEQETSSAIGAIYEPAAIDPIPLHTSVCTSFPSLSLPSLLDCSLPPDGDQDQRKMLRRFARESRRMRNLRRQPDRTRSRSGPSSPSALPVGCMDEARRLGCILHTVMEQLDSDEERFDVSPHLGAPDDMFFDEDESFLFSD